MKDKVAQFLKEKNMISDLDKRFVITGSFGVFTLNDLLEEFASELCNQAYGEGYQEGVNDVMSRI